MDETNMEADGVQQERQANNEKILLDLEGQESGFLARVAEADLLEVEDDFRHIFHNAGKRGKFMLRTGDANGRNGSAFQRAEKYAAQGVAESMPESVFKRFGNEGQTVGVFGVFDLFEMARHFETAQNRHFILYVFLIRHGRIGFTGFPSWRADRE